VYLYELHFLKNDVVGMAQEVAWAAGKPGVEDVLLGLEADTAAYTGRLGQARDLSRRAVASAKRSGEKEVAAAYEADAALREALFGNPAEARERTAEALSLSTGPYAQFAAALALTFAGDAVRSRALADDLGNRFPEHTIIQFNYLPTIRAQLALNRDDSSKAIEILQTAGSYELSESGRLYPVYVRGEAYLAAHQGSEAATEFQKILDHRGIVLNEPIGALAHLQIGRAYAMQGDTAKAKAAYQDFLTLWKDADPDIPILKEAKAEYAKLR
jgi:eukaryotic-like serine/threonine-protein kinase